jgi:MFS transporter, OFA family, oxalate/formate antiporter
MKKKQQQTPAVSNKGWLVTFAGTSALLALGVLYAWSVFKANIPADWGWTDSQKSLPYSVACVLFSVMTLVGARLLSRFGPRWMVRAGGVLAGLGVIISSQSTSPWVFTLAFGGLLGSGIGFVYASASPTALKWFPASKTGLISGIVVGGFGMGSAWVAPLARTMIASFGLQNTMLYLGIGMLVAVVGFAQLLQTPPAGFQPEGAKPAKGSAKVTNEKIEFTARETFKTWQFYAIWIAFAMGSGAGLMIIGNLASIVSEQIGLGAVSAVAVAALAVGNGSGRVLYGALSDRIGRKPTLIIAFIFQAALIVGLSLVKTGSSLASVPVLMTLVVLIGANYGANLSVFPAITKDYYGLKNFAMNYGMVYMAWGLGGFMLSQVTGVIRDLSGSYNNAYLLAAGLLLVAAVLTALMKSPQARPTVTPAASSKLASARR